MSGLELPTVTSAAWVVWEPLTSGDLLTAGLTAAIGIPALTLAGVGLWQMRRASMDRNRQLDAQTETLARHSETLAALVRMLDERTAVLTAGMQTMAQGIETIIERTAPGGGGEKA